MKCPYCDKKPTMTRKGDSDHNYWWECPNCHKTVGKPEKKEEE